MLKVTSMVEEPLQPLTSRIEETIKLGLSPEEGAKRVGLYVAGYRLLVQTMAIRDHNKDPLIRNKAHHLLSTVDENGELGKHNSDITAFVLTYFERRTPAYTWSKLAFPGRTNFEDLLKVLIDRPTVSDDDRKRATELLNGIVDGKMLTHLFTEAKALIAKNKIHGRTVSKKNHAQAFHAIEHACNACENLSEVQLSLVTQEERAVLLTILGDAAMSLLKIQSKLLGGSK